MKPLRKVTSQVDAESEAVYKAVDEAAYDATFGAVRDAIDVTVPSGMAIREGITK